MDAVIVVAFFCAFVAALSLYLLWPRPHIHQATKESMRDYTHK